VFEYTFFFGGLWGAFMGFMMAFFPLDVAKTAMVPAVANLAATVEGQWPMVFCGTVMIAQGLLQVSSHEQRSRGLRMIRYY